MSLDNWVIMRSGFTQTKGKPGNGCVDIVGELAQRYGGNGNRIELEAWKDCPEHTAHYIHRLSSKKNPPRIALFGYSWGCGYGIVRLAKALDARGIHVKYAVLCDPVRYSILPWRAMMQKTFYKKFKIKLPPNIHEVFWLRQSVNVPSGYDLVATSSYTTIHRPKIVNVRHQEMDNTPEFKIMCLKVAQMMFEPEKGQ
jgi:pimeloyl-ACP methyl ester carboxylesterase